MLNLDDIEPGLTVMGPAEGYSIFLRQTKKEGDKAYQLLIINQNLMDLQEDEYRSTGIGGNNLMVNAFCNTYTPRGLDLMLHGRMIQQAGLDEVACLGDLIMNGDSMEYVRSTLEGAGIEELYNAHPAVDRYPGF